jgi:hypothetical protein
LQQEKTRKPRKKKKWQEEQLNSPLKRQQDRLKKKSVREQMRKRNGLLKNVELKRKEKSNRDLKNFNKKKLSVLRKKQEPSKKS